MFIDTSNNHSTISDSSFLTIGIVFPWHINSKVIISDLNAFSWEHSFQLFNLFFLLLHSLFCSFLLSNQPAHLCFFHFKRCWVPCCLHVSVLPVTELEVVLFPHLELKVSCQWHSLNWLLFFWKVKRWHKLFVVNVDIRPNADCVFSNLVLESFLYAKLD